MRPGAAALEVERGQVQQHCLGWGEGRCSSPWGGGLHLRLPSCFGHEAAHAARVLRPATALSSCPHLPPPTMPPHQPCRHTQVAYNRVAAVKALLDNGADTAARDNAGNPPLHYAVGCAFERRRGVECVGVCGLACGFTTQLGKSTGGTTKPLVAVVVPALLNPVPTALSAAALPTRCAATGGRSACGCCWRRALTWRLGTTRGRRRRRCVLPGVVQTCGHS